jgi:hypothetical protein
MYDHVILEKNRLKEYRGIIKEGISRWWKSKLFVFRATMLKYEHFEVVISITLNYIMCLRGDFEILAGRQFSAIFWRSAALKLASNAFISFDN